ncbi:MAG: hypothetical protein ACRDON_01540 [Gaiellaceae bacterium]
MATVLALALLALLSPTGAAVGALLGRLGPPTEGPAPRETERSSIPALTEEEQARAVSLLASDPRAARLLGGLRYEIREIGVWHTSKTKRTIGASLVIVLAEPTRIEGVWPDKAYDEAERKSVPYAEKSTRFTAANVTELMVSVDLGRGKVVSIAPGPNAIVTVPPGYEPDVPDHID